MKKYKIEFFIIDLNADIENETPKSIIESDDILTNEVILKGLEVYELYHHESAYENSLGFGSDKMPIFHILINNEEADDSEQLERIIISSFDHKTQSKTIGAWLYNCDNLYILYSVLEDQIIKDNCEEFDSIEKAKTHLISLMNDKINNLSKDILKLQKDDMKETRQITINI